MVSRSKELPDWEVGPAHYPSADRLRLIALLAVPAILLVLSGALVATGASAAGALGAALALAGVFLLARGWVTPQPLRDAAVLQDARFENLVAGLAGRIGMETPRLLLIESGGPNALVWPGNQPAFAVTRSLLDSYTRTEQEAVAAHCLLRIHSGRLTFTRLAACLGRAGRSLAPRVGYEDDVHAAALTRYPPGLADAVRKATPAQGPAASAWFVADDPSHREPAERTAQLLTL